MSQRPNSVRWIVLTDLDGTLLDHHSYSASAAQEALSCLALHNIPCLFNTSKTFAEVVQLRRALNNQAPFICENGSALFVPRQGQQYSPLSTDPCDYNTEILGAPYQDLIKVLHQARQQGFHFRSFNDMPDAEVSAVTGLDQSAARLAKQRHASEPLLWLGQPSELTDFRHWINQQGLHLVKGGRFYHLMGTTDKASAIGFFRDFYSHQYQLPTSAIRVIALGDGENDRCMLEQSDQPVVIPAADGSTLKLTHEQLISAHAPGPVGWNKAILQLLDSRSTELGA